MNKDIIEQLGYVMMYAIFALIVTSFGIYVFWNWLIPDILGLRNITLLESFGLNVLSKMFFQSFEFTIERD